MKSTAYSLPFFALTLNACLIGIAERDAYYMIDNDGDNYAVVEDCDDSDVNTYPGAAETCNDLKENNCDHRVATPDCAAVAACGWTGERAIEHDGALWSNTQEGDTAGGGLAVVSGLSKDRAVNLLVGVPTYHRPDTEDSSGDTGTPSSDGAVFLVSSSVGGAGGRLADQPMWTTASGSTGESLGASVAGLPDIDGDGLSEVVFGAPYADQDDDVNAGAIYVVSGAEAVEGGQLSSEGRIAGDGAYLAAGAALAAALWPDQTPLLVVGVPSYPDDGESLANSGAVFILTGDPDGVGGLSGGRLTSSVENWAGAIDGGYAGASLAFVDGDGDGSPELMIGAPLTDVEDADEAGSVYVVNGDHVREGGALSDSLSWSGGAAHDRAGLVVASVGDLNQDGYADMGAAVPSRSPGTYTGARGVSRFLLIAGASSLSGGPLDEAGAVWTGTLSEITDSVSIAGVGDVDGDCIDDVAVGLEAPANADGGGVFVISGERALSGGQVGGVDLAWTGSDESARAGNSIVSLGDLNEDGLSELMVGAPLSGVWALWSQGK